MAVSMRPGHTAFWRSVGERSQVLRACCALERAQARLIYRCFQRVCAQTLVSWNVHHPSIHPTHHANVALGKLKGHLASQCDEARVCRRVSRRAGVAKHAGPIHRRAEYNRTAVAITLRRLLQVREREPICEKVGPSVHACFIASYAKRQPCIKRELTYACKQQDLTRARLTPGRMVMI